jgi:hypothetical protein
LVSVAGELLDAMQFGANDGQLRDPLERRQTVVVYSDGLSLTDFGPPPDTLDNALKNGYNAMATYYGMPGV